MMKLKNLVLTLLAIATLSLAAHADIIFLKDGRLLHVKILAGDDKGIEVQRLDNHGKLFIRWSMLREEDRKRLRIHFGLEEDDSTADLLMDGHRVYVRRGDYYDGIIESEDQETVTLRREGKEYVFRREAIRRLEERQVSVFDVYTAEELYQQRLSEISPTDDDVVGHFEMAKYATKIGMYSEALIHYTTLAEEDPEYKTEYVENQKKRLEILDKNKEIRNAITEAERAGRRNRYTECLGFFDEVLAVPTLDKEIRKEVEKKKAKFEKRRWAWFADIVEKSYHRMVNKKITKMARSRDIKHRDEEKRLTIDKVMTHLRTNLHKEIVEELAEKHELDPKKEVEKMWEERKSRGTRTASYGSGTFIVKGRAGSRRRGGQQNRAQQLLERIRQRGRGGQQGGGQQQVKQPKLLSKDEWWSGADSVMRTFWMRAYFAEKGGKMEVTNSTIRPCSNCGGTGTLKKLGSQGGYVKVTCPRCQGHKADTVITYR